MGFLTRLLTLLAIGGVCLFAWFAVVAEVDPREVGRVSVAVAAVAVVLGLRGLRLDHERRSRAGDPRLREVFNRQRERRGF